MHAQATVSVGTLTRACAMMDIVASSATSTNATDETVRTSMCVRNTASVKQPMFVSVNLDTLAMIANPMVVIGMLPIHAMDTAIAPNSGVRARRVISVVCVKRSLATQP